VKISLALAALFVSFSSVFADTSHELRSPDNRIVVTVRVGDRIRYDVRVNGNLVLQDSTLSLDVDHQKLGHDAKFEAAKSDSVDRVIEPPIKLKFAKIPERYNELRLSFTGFALTFRAYNEGVAYRFETSLPQSEVKVYGEEATFNFAANYNVYYPKEDTFFSHNEREFLQLPLNKIEDKSIASLPAVVVAPDRMKLAIAESDVDDYPGLWLHGNSNNSLTATFPPVPLKETVPDRIRDRDIKVTEAADYIAVTKGTRTYPWRIIGVAATDADLITNSIVYLLAKPSEVTDTSWIKPGKVPWDWYNALNIYGVDFKSGINTQTYKYYIDFASKYGIEYIIIDEGWYNLGNVLDVVPAMNIEEIVAYGKQKNVGVILWMVWKTLDDQLLPAMEQFEKWDVKGLKVDFMQRDDQKVINFYHRLCREAAKRKMIVDFHGAIRPATMVRTWPNLINTEGVRGLEWNKWSKLTTPEHNVTLPFTRMFLGPLDYTPGAMVNSGNERNFASIFERPMSLGTRCHQLAMYVVFEAPLQMLADSPSHYLKEPEVMEFLGPVPTVWDETKVLAAEMGDYVVIARRNGRDWYIGAMTDWTPRDVEIDLSFLPAGSFRMTLFADGPNADRSGSDYKKSVQDIDKNSRLKIHLMGGGGFAARLTPAIS
jgi:alpha-glucosidase